MKNDYSEDPKRQPMHPGSDSDGLGSPVIQQQIMLAIQLMKKAFTREFLSRLRRGDDLLSGLTTKGQPGRTIP